jgi:hypothetical protein
MSVVVVVEICSTILSPRTHPPPYASKTRVRNNEEKGMHFQLTLQQVLACKSTYIFVMRCEFLDFLTHHSFIMCVCVCVFFYFRLFDLLCDVAKVMIIILKKI